MNTAHKLIREINNLPNHVRKLLAGTAKAYAESHTARHFHALTQAMRMARNMYGFGNYSPHELADNINELKPA